MLILTQSAIKALHQCPMKYQLAYVECWRRNETQPYLEIGTACHLYWELTLKGSSHRDAMQAVRDYIATCVCDQDEVQLALAMCQAYHEHYTEPLVPVMLRGKPAVEVQFKGRIKDPATGKLFRGVRFSGKIDVIVETELGPMIVDHKTKGGSIGGGYQDAVWQDFQLRAYAAAARDYLGVPVVGALYDVVAKTALRLRKGELPSDLLDRQVARYREQPDEMFARVPVLFEERHIESARQEIADAVRLVRGFHNDGWFPGHRTQCRNPVTGHKACDFLAYCDGGRDPHLLRMDFHQEDTPHTELSDAAAT